MTAIRIGEIVGLIVAAMFGSAGFWTWINGRKQKQQIYDQAYRAGIEGSSVLDKRAISLLDPYVQQVEYLTRQLECSQQESIAARKESRMAREESSSLRTELAAAMKRIGDLENILVSHGLAVEGA